MRYLKHVSGMMHTVEEQMFENDGQLCILVLYYKKQEQLFTLHSEYQPTGDQPGGNRSFPRERSGILCILVLEGIKTPAILWFLVLFSPYFVD